MSGQGKPGDWAPESCLNKKKSKDEHRAPKGKGSDATESERPWASVRQDFAR